MLAAMHATWRSRLTTLALLVLGSFSAALSRAEGPAASLSGDLTFAQRAAVEEFLGARSSGDPLAMANALHPAELEELRTRVLGLLHEEAKKGDSSIRGRLFGPAMPLASIERLTSLNFYAAIAPKLALPGRAYESIHALASVPAHGGNVHAVIEGTQTKERGSKVRVVELVTLRPYGKDWKAAIPDELNAQIDDLIRGRSSVALSERGVAAVPVAGNTPPGIAQLLDSAEQSLSASRCDEYYKERMSKNFRDVTSKKALETLISSCQNNAGMRQMLIATLHLVRERQPQFEYDGQRAVYDLSGQGLPFDRFVLEQIDKRWYIAE